MAALDESDKQEDVETPPLRVLLANRARFLAFVQSRVGNRADAEEILQAAFTRSVEAVANVRDEESVVAWFYRMLRNAIVDHYRRRGAEQRALDQLAHELPDESSNAADEVRAGVCACVTALLPTLRPEQREILRQVDLEDRPVNVVAEVEGITAGNARVRLHRAREALRARVHATCGACAEHGCMNCTCHQREGEEKRL